MKPSPFYKDGSRLAQKPGQKAVPGEGVEPPQPVSHPHPTEKPAPVEAPRPNPAPARGDRAVSFLGWIVALGLVAFAGYLWRFPPGQVSAPTMGPAPPIQVAAVSEGAAVLPAFQPQMAVKAVARLTDLHTIIPTRPRAKVISYKVEAGDSLFGIAKFYGLEPETLLWANYDLLNDNPDYLAPGMELNVPPVDGVYYRWEANDSLESVAQKFEAKVDEITGFSGNNFDLANPEIAAGQMVMVPGGHREFRQWLIPTIARGSAGVNTTALGPGACSGSYEGAYGSGAFIWPTGNHFLSGNDYWSGHLGIDIAAGLGVSVVAADAGVVVFSGWANGGYGYTVMIDHGNGYQSLYAHLSQASVPCGASVGAGRLIALAGSTGNSTGAHLHFEVRYEGGFINPWFVLPAP